MTRWRYAKRMGLALLALVVIVWLVSVVAVIAWARRDSAQPAAAIVVMGAAQYVGRPSPVLRARLDHAIALWRQGMAPRLVLTGGTGVGDTTSEAAVGRAYALRRGVPESALVLENRGRTTAESMRAVAAFMRTQSEQSVILVSDPFHMLRLSILSQRLGLTAYTSPTRTSPISDSPAQVSKYVLGESVKVPLAFILERKHDEH